MISYIKSKNFGKGFITHTDQQVDGLSFECFGDLVKVTGESAKITAWKNRVKGVVITASDYLLQKKALERIGIENRLIEIEKEKTDLMSKLKNN
jgi:hypothetical protein